MDIKMEVVDDEGQECLVAHFFFVARSPLTKISAPVNPLKLVTAAEKELFEDGERRAAERRQKGSQLYSSTGDVKAKQEWVTGIMKRAQAAMDMPALVAPVRPIQHICRAP